MSLSNLLIIFSSSFMALFPVINPLGNGFVVNGFFTDLDPQQRKAAIQKLTLNFIMIGVGTLVIGHLFLFDILPSETVYILTGFFFIRPGSISVIFTLMASASVKGKLLQTGINYLVIALVIICMAAIFYVFLSQGQRFIQRLGPVGNQIINKLVAFFTFCIGIQISVTGISQIFHLNIL